MSLPAWMPQQSTENDKDTLEPYLITLFELSDRNPAPIFPEQTLYSLVLSLRGVAELQHTKDLGLWRKKSSFLKQNHSAREEFPPTLALHLPNFSPTRVRTQKSRITVGCF